MGVRGLQRADMMEQTKIQIILKKTKIKQKLNVPI